MIRDAHVDTIAQEEKGVDMTSADITVLSRRSRSKRAMNRTSVIPPVQTRQPLNVESEGQSPTLPALALPPPLGESLDNSLGWADEFGIRLENRGLLHRPWLTDGRTFSESSQRTTWSQPSRPVSRQSMRDRTQSRDFFNAQEESLALKTPLTVLETEQSGLGISTEWTMSSAIFAETETLSLRRDTNQVRLRESTGDSRPPRVSLQDPASDDWAAAVLEAMNESNDL